MSVGRNLYESQYLFLIRCYFDIKVWPTLELCYNTYISVPRFHTSQSLSDISSASNIKACCCAVISISNNAIVNNFFIINSI